MRNIKKVIIYGVLAILTLSFVYIVYPRSGTLEDLVLENYKTEEFTYGKLNIFGRLNIEDEAYTIAEDNKDKVEGFLNEIKDIKIKEISKIKEEDINEEYNLRLYSYSNSETLGFAIFDFKYIRIFGNVKGRYRTSMYKILNEEDRNLLKEKIEEIKNES